MSQNSIEQIDAVIRCAIRLADAVDACDYTQLRALADRIGVPPKNGSSPLRLVVKHNLLKRANDPAFCDGE